MENGLLCRGDLSVRTRIVARVQISVEAGKVATRYFQADAVAFLE